MTRVLAASAREDGPIARSSRRRGTGPSLAWRSGTWEVPAHEVAMIETLSPLLECIGTGPLRSDALARALRGGVDVPALLARARFDADRYTRVLLYRDERLEVRLLCWKQGQTGELHDHGGSACAFRVLSGVATEHRLGRPDRVLRPGDVAEAGEDVVHQVGNLGSEPLITLHVYAPPLEEREPVEDVRRVVVIGGGWSGAALAMHLLEGGGPELRVTLVERGPALGRGVAYDTPDPEHLLNVPASGMSVDPRDPEEFLRFARARGLQASPDDLLPRRLYGDYVEERLARVIATRPGTLRLARGEAVSVERGPDGWTVGLADGRALRAHDVVLATGNARPHVPAGLHAVADDPRVVLDPWAPGALASVQADERVLVVGTGLTALDVLSTLRRQGHPGPVWALSRNGRWPRPHLPEVHWHGPSYPIDVDSAPRTADGLASWLDAHIAEARSRDLPWQAVLGAVRPHVTTLWKSLPQEERARFLATHRSAWEVLRHRAPFRMHNERRGWEAQGWLTTLRGEIRGCAGAGVRLVLEVEGQGDGLEVDRIVLCTGPDADVRRFTDPLWRQLLGRGHALPDPLGLGLLTDEDGAVEGARGRQRGLWALGCLERPRFFEVTSVPDLSKRALALAERLLAEPAAP